MDKEKIIRQQSKASLRNNWITVISGLFVVFASWVIAYIIFAIACIIADAFGINTDSTTVTLQNDIVSVALIVFLFLIVFLVSPIINGFFKLCYSVSTKKEAEFSDMFYFFSSIKLYTKTIHFNSIILIKKFIYFFLSLIPFTVFAVLCFATCLLEPMPKELSFAVLMVLLAAGIIAGILLTVKYLFDSFIYASGEFDNLSDIFDAARIIREKHSADLRGLLYTFTGWILLCFFVIPVLYVAPYFFTSAATSSKWLLSLYKEGKMA